MPRRKTVDYGPHNNASAADTTDIVELDDAGETAANDNEIVDSIEVATNNENELNYGAQVATETTHISQLAEAGETAANDNEIANSIEVATNNENELNYGAQ